MNSDDPVVQRVVDSAVLLALGAFVVLLPVRAGFLSSCVGTGGAVSRDAVGWALTAAGVLIAGAYAWLACGSKASSQRLRAWLVILAMAVFVLAPTLSDMAARVEWGIQKDGRYVAFPHDGGVLQTEAAIDFLRAGRNPYAETYDETAMVQSHHSNPRLWKSLGFERNPALDFFPYPPFNVLLSFPVAYLWKGLLQWYDQRVVYIAALLVLAGIAYRFAPRDVLRPLYLVVLAANPLYTSYFVQGFNDTLCVLFVVLCILCLRRLQTGWAGIFLGMACGCKQFAWLLVPLYAAVVWYQAKSLMPDNPGRAFIEGLVPLLVTGAFIFVPFLVWGPRDMWHDLVVGQGALYPIRAHGLGMTSFLVMTDVLRSPRDALPGWWIYAVVMLPVWVAGVFRTARTGAVTTMAGWYAATLFLFCFVSRFFAPNYVWLLSVLVCLTLLPPQEPKLDRL